MKKQWDNVIPRSPEVAKTLKALYDATSPERRFDRDMTRIFSKEELIDGAYKQAGRELKE